MKVAVVATGLANLASVRAALSRAGAEAEPMLDPDRVYAADHVVLPGVGALGPAMEALCRAGLDEALRERVARGKSLLAICLGLQLLCEASEESGGSRALAVFARTARRFPQRDGVRVPHLGWNRVEAGAGCRLLETGYASFAHSYRLEEAPPGTAVGWSDHGGPFVAAVEQGSVLATQFHPELSGAYGAGLLARWLAGSC